jgi:UDP-2-acetamido-3-amino-2,3-dideoxy-glucuronate N-acetyltransferase
MPCPDNDREPVGRRTVPSVNLETCKLPVMTDSRGSITVCEFADLPFPPQRLFVEHGVAESARRGEHAHKECHQLFVCLEGSMRLAVDDGSEDRVYTLDDPGMGYFVPAGLWVDMSEFEPGTVVLVLTNLPYDPDDYIRDRAQYLEWLAGRI